MPNSWLKKRWFALNFGQLNALTKKYGLPKNLQMIERIYWLVVGQKRVPTSFPI
jgi:hypothetical protein